ncbi:MAG: hypothetical protein J6U64_00235, partial [Alphaproteobacteria bacterium]|nr:hypothetical protein [Alphaproteobacteria bacterium]
NTDTSSIDTTSTDTSSTDTSSTDTTSTETTEPEDKCVKADGTRVECDNCCDCDSKTGACTKDCTTTAEKPECCNNTAYAPCPEGKLRNAETCACECSASKCQEVYGDNYECCQNNCVEFCPEGEIRDMTTCECCSEVNFCKERCYDACSEGKTRNQETCECDCETVLECTHEGQWNHETCQCDCQDEDHIYAYCGISEEGIPEDQKKEINEVCDCVCPKGKEECGWNRCYDPETQECCNDEIKEACTINGQTRNPTTCECECLDKMIVCGESCVTAPSPVIENCEKLSDDGCEIISACTEGQVCCGGECIEKPTPDESKCEKLSDDECKIVSSCSEGQSCCAGECMIQPTCDTNACQRLSEDGCTCDIICGEGQTCDGNGNCVEASACEEGQKVCGAGENTWCCPSDNECGTNTGECCVSLRRYDFDESREYYEKECTILQKDEQISCQTYLDVDIEITRTVCAVCPKGSFLLHYASPGTCSDLCEGSNCFFASNPEICCFDEPYCRSGEISDDDGNPVGIIGVSYLCDTYVDARYF